MPRPLLAITLMLAACAPTLTAQATEASRTFPATCTEALQAVQVAGNQTRLTNAWNTYRTTNTTADQVVLSADTRTGPTGHTTSTWTCQQTADPAASNAATLTVRTTALNADVADRLHAAFFQAIQTSLQRP